MKPIEIPTHHDDPQWIIIWPIDELLPVLTCLVMGILFSQVSMLLIVGFFISISYKTAKQTKHSGFIQHWLYSKGIYISSTKTLSNTFNRRYIAR